MSPEKPEAVLRDQYYAIRKSIGLFPPDILFQLTWAIPTFRFQWIRDLYLKPPSQQPGKRKGPLSLNSWYSHIHVLAAAGVRWTRLLVRRLRKTTAGV